MKRTKTASGRDAVLEIRVTPRSRRPGIGGLRSGVLTVAVAAPPERGRATQEARRAVASWLGIPPARVLVEAGATSREKRLRIRGLAPSDLRKHIEQHAADGPAAIG